MTRQLTQEARNTMMNNTVLFGEVCDLLKVRPVSLPVLLYRNSPRLSNHDVVIKVAKYMGKSPEDILEHVDQAVGT